MTHRWEFNVKYLNQGKDVTTLHSMQSRKTKCSKFEDQNLTPNIHFYISSA